MISLLMFGGLFIIMYFMLIRPQRKRQKEHQELINSLNKGDEVVLTSGMIGKITAINDNYITLDTGNVELKFQRVAVHAVLPKGTMKGIG
jgi:preprotein translocase subunit YajC